MAHRRTACGAEVRRLVVAPEALGNVCLSGAEALRDDFGEALAHDEAHARGEIAVHGAPQTGPRHFRPTPDGSHERLVHDAGEVHRQQRQQLEQARDGAVLRRGIAAAVGWRRVDEQGCRRRDADPEVLPAPLDALEDAGLEPLVVVGGGLGRAAVQFAVRAQHKNRAAGGAARLATAEPEELAARLVARAKLADAPELLAVRHRFGQRRRGVIVALGARLEEAHDLRVVESRGAEPRAHGADTAVVRLGPTAGGVRPAEA
mmetsp:Transcript_22448/g.69509  ORF Transcript_22448/g.69509 Transcript_22448/m.69509 type:complete len:261 (-) Transcript_22448:1168-1950(-)